MANTMFSSRTNELKENFSKFVQNVKKSGKNPQQLLDEAMKSGKYSQADLNKAKMMAEVFAKILK